MEIISPLQENGSNLGIVGTPWPETTLNMHHEKLTNIDQLSDIPTIWSEQDTDDLMKALAEANRPRR